MKAMITPRPRRRTNSGSNVISDRQAQRLREMTETEPKKTCDSAAFFDLAERLRAASDPKEAKRLGEQLGRMVFGKPNTDSPQRRSAR